MLIAALVVVAMADTLVDRVKSCAGLSDSLARLQCFDAAAKTLTATTAAAPPEVGPSGWKVSEGVNPLNDKPQVTATALSAEENAMFTIRCKDSETDAYINFGKYLGSDPIVVTWRLDDEKAKSERWGVSTDHKAAFSPGAFALTERLATGKRLVMQATPYSESPITASFDLTGAASVVKKLRAVCASK